MAAFVLDMVLISIGSIECHGRHMPLGTDTLIPEHLLEKIEKKSDVLIAPTIPCILNNFQFCASNTL